MGQLCDRCVLLFFSFLVSFWNVPTLILILIVFLPVFRFELLLRSILVA